MLEEQEEYINTCDGHDAGRTEEILRYYGQLCSKCELYLNHHKKSEIIGFSIRTEANSQITEEINK